MEHKQCKSIAEQDSPNDTDPQHFKIIEAMELKKYCIEVRLNIITSVPYFMKIYQAVQKLIVGGHTVNHL
jgi:hypothetical protein